MITIHSLVIALRIILKRTILFGKWAKFTKNLSVCVPFDPVTQLLEN